MLTGINPASKGAEEKFLPLQDFDEGLSYSLELLIEDCTIADPAERLPCSPREYTKMEKESMRAVKSRSERGVIYEKNVRR